MINNLAAVAKSGSYNDLKNKPNLAAVATSGSYNDLANKPSIPTNYVAKDNGATGVGSFNYATNYKSGSGYTQFITENGATIAGGSLTVKAGIGSSSSATLPGTWRNVTGMGVISVRYSGNDPTLNYGIFQRIA